MPVELLIGVLFISVVVNAALLLWLSRADHVRIHWSHHLLPILDAFGRPEPPSSRDIPTVRRRALFVAASPNARGSDNCAGNGASAQFSSAGSMPTTRTPLSQTLPSDLADFLSRPATIALNPDGMAAPGPALARMPVLPHGIPAGMALDPLTGLEGPAGWARIIETENARLLRYRRPLTVVVAEVEGLRRLAERLGEEPVERLLPVIADAFRREARSSDWVARIGNGRFAAFLPETDEIQAINYVERIRLVCEPWLASSAVPLRLAIGWSSPSASSDIEYALERAEERMHLDRRVPGKSLPTQRVGPARVVSVSRPDPNGPSSEDETLELVPPAETGRVHEAAARETTPEVTIAGKSAEVSIGKGRHRPPRTKAEPRRQAKP